MHASLKIIKTLLYSYSAVRVSGILAPIIRSLLILHIEPPVTYQLKHIVGFRIMCAKQAKEVYEYKNIKQKLRKTTAAIWFNKTCRDT
jgi:hypothetical protein